MEHEYGRAWWGYIARIGLIVGGLHLLILGVTGVPILEKIFGEAVWVVYSGIGLCALLLMANRDTYLPFLGPSHVPCGALELRTPTGANREVVIQTTPKTKILYWAAEPATEGVKDIPSWKGAYLGYDNMGITQSDASGRAVLRVRQAQPYRVPIKGLLEPHVHYRVCEASGWLGRVMTIPLEGAPAVEPFSGVTHEYTATWI